MHFLNIVLLLRQTHKVETKSYKKKVKENLLKEDFKYPMSVLRVMKKGITRKKID